MSAQRSLRRGLLLCTLFLCTAATLKAEVLERSFTWRYNNKSYANTFHFSTSSYNYYKKVKRNYSDFTFYMEESKNYAVVQDIATVLKAMAQKNNLSDVQTVEFISAFVQNIGYKDDGYYEYPRFPIETLVEKAGDCEDTAILLAALLQHLGYNVILVSPKGHMGVGIAVKDKMNGNAFPYNGYNYYYIETTSSGWGIGDYPEKLSDQVRLYDPGQYADARPVNGSSSYDNTATAQNTSTTKTGSSGSTSNTQNKNTAAQTTSNTKTTSSGTSKTNSSHNTTSTASQNTTTNHYAANYTIEEDIVVIDGEKQTMVTKAEYNGEDFEVVAGTK